MSTAENRQLHIAPEKIEIEDRSYGFEEKERDRDIEVSKVTDGAYMKDTRAFQIQKHISPSKTSISPRESNLSNSDTSFSEKSSDVSALKNEIAKLRASLEKKEAENKLILKEKIALEAINKKIQSAKNKLEAYAKQRMANYNDHHLRSLQEGDDKLKHQQAKIDAALAQNAELKRLLAKKTAENIQVAKQKDALAAEYKRISHDKKELEVFTKKKLAITKDKHAKALHERTDKLKQSQFHLDAAYAEIAKLKSLLGRKETENKQITDENDVLEAKYKKSKSDRKELEAYAKKKLVATKHKYQQVLQERNAMLKRKQDKIDAMNCRNRR